MDILCSYVWPGNVRELENEVKRLSVLAGPVVEREAISPQILDAGQMLVGKDTKMHELMIFFGTLGGIMMFGIAGVLIGPVIASLFVTIWELYGIAFSDYLPEVYYRKESPDPVESKDD